MNFIGKVKYHLQRILFDKYAIPVVKHERIAKVFIKKYLPLNPVIIDCGAHDGSDTVQLATIFKRGTVHAFEPVDHLYEQLVNKSKHHDNISCYKIALADKTGEMNFYISEGTSDASSSLLEPKEHLKDHPGTLFSNKITVATSSLDNWAKENKINKVDMLWLDMQGYELNMLKASKEVLDTVSVIHTEVSTKETYKDVAQYKEYRAFLEQQGFKVKVEAIPEGWDMGNVLFIRNIN